MRLNLGQIIDLLERRPKDQEIRFDFAGLQPQKVRSYRGNYSHLAMGYREWVDCVVVSEVLEDLRKAVGKEFRGYKGGEFLMTADAKVWVANWGFTGDTVINGVLGFEDRTILTTGYCEYS